VSSGAFHDSGERFDPPKCHPNAQVAVIQDILDWLDDLESPETCHKISDRADHCTDAL
ncbi:hypothetical protein BYT27DRAFT_7091137, partial [Phlegmacium glaucopus]